MGRIRSIFMLKEASKLTRKLIGYNFFRGLDGLMSLIETLMHFPGYKDAGR